MNRIVLFVLVVSNVAVGAGGYFLGRNQAAHPTPSVVSVPADPEQDQGSKDDELGRVAYEGMQELIVACARARWNIEVFKKAEAVLKKEGTKYAEGITGTKELIDAQIKLHDTVARKYNQGMAESDNVFANTDNLPPGKSIPLPREIPLLDPQ